jgi:hypothetical protein
VAHVARRLLVGALIAGFLAVIARLPWEWSLMDDSGLLDIVEPRVSVHGPIGGFILAVGDMYHFDLVGGLFRPAYWVYAAGLYQLPVGAAHAIQVAMLPAVFAGAVAAVVDRASGQRRAVLTVWTVLAVGANGHCSWGSGTRRCRS